MRNRLMSSSRAKATRRWAVTIAFVAVLATIVASGWYGASWSSAIAPPARPIRSGTATGPFTSFAIASGTVIVQINRTGAHLPLRNGVVRLGQPDLLWAPMVAWTRSGDYYRIPLWPLAALLAVPVFITWGRFWQRRAAGACLRCGYPVGANDVCTECGAALDAPRA